MQIILNGETLKLDSEQNITELLNHYGLDKTKVAVERNLEIISASEFEETYLNDGDNLEIIHFIGGG